MVMVGVLFKMMVMMFGNMGENKFKTDFNNDERNDDANVSFDVDAPNKVNNSGS